MSMDSRRFGGGLAVGILLGLVVIAATGLAAVPEAAPVTNYAATTTAPTTTFSTSSTTVFASTTSAATSTSTSVQYTYGAGQPNSTSQSATSYTVTSSTPAGVKASTATHSSPFDFLQTGLTSLPSSSFAALSTQSPHANAFLVVPILVAFLLGAVLYRTTLKTRAPPEDEEKPAA